MTVNADKPRLWKADVEQSIDFYNDWFLRFAPETFRLQRAETTIQVANALEMTDYLRNVRPEVLQANPGILPMLRMICAPPLAREAKKITEMAAQYEVATDTKENQRFVFQQETDSIKTQSDRNKMGQFSTPFSLAEDIATYAHSLAVSNTQRISFLEPALGSGVFFSALESNIPHDQIELATGVELDVDYAKIASNFWSAPPFEVRNIDFLEFSSLLDGQEKYSLLCTNPPYVRHHHLLSASKLTLQNRVVQELQLRPSGLSGLYVYFMLLAHNLLQNGGIASWLVPSEFLSVNYGRVLREYLLRRVTLVRIHQFDPTDVQFDDALVSSCVVTYRKISPYKPYEFEFSYGGTLNNPKQIRVVNSDIASPVEKWSYAGIGSDGHDASDGVRLGDIFDIKRGIATGSNGFFIVDQGTIAEYDIPEQFLQPILPSPRYIKEQVIDADDRGDPTIDSARHLVNCDLPPDRVKSQFPNFWRYFELGESKGIPEGYLCASRKIWYLQEQREPAMYMATYMSRSRSTSGNPFRFFLNKSAAVGTNVFLLLYPKAGIREALDGREDRMLQLLGMLNGLGREQVLGKGRTYGGGLHKLEPKELANLQFSDAPDWLQGQTQMKLEFA